MTISRPIVYGLMLTSVLSLFFTVPGDKGLIRSYQLYQELRDIKGQNASLSEKNGALAQEAIMLRENLAYIEHVIIQEMNLVRPGDKIVVFRKAKN
ncbi:MAG: septum formation initiator family protein [Desulfomonilia bacterium]